jgi:hypothetical protein
LNVPKQFFSNFERINENKMATIEIKNKLSKDKIKMVVQ